jgi:hypothetical protein
MSARDALRRTATMSTTIELKWLGRANASVIDAASRMSATSAFGLDGRRIKVWFIAG